MSLFSFFNPFIIISYVLTLKLHFWLTFYFDHPTQRFLAVLDIFSKGRDFCEERGVKLQLMGGRDWFKVRLNIGGGRGHQKLCGLQYNSRNIGTWIYASYYESKLVRIRMGFAILRIPNFIRIRRNANPNQIGIRRIASPTNL